MAVPHPEEQRRQGQSWEGAEDHIAASQALCCCLPLASCKPEWVSGLPKARWGLNEVLDPDGMCTSSLCFTLYALSHQGDDGIPGEPGLTGSKVGFCLLSI